MKSVSLLVIHNIVGDVIPRPSDDLLTAACGACTTGEIEGPVNTVSKSFLKAGGEIMSL